MQRVVFFLITLFVVPMTFASPWRFDITPYIWAINMNGRVGIGPETGHVDQSFNDLLKQLDVAAMLYVAAHKDDFGLYLNGIYTVTSDSSDPYDISVKVKNKFGIFGGGISYIIFNREFPNNRRLMLEPYIGVRYTSNKTTLKVASLTFNKNITWSDPLVGLILNYAFNMRWAAQLMADIGGINGSTHYSYSAGAYLSYHLWKNGKVLLGYRILDQRYQTGNGAQLYNWDMKMFGPLLGITFSF